MPLPVCRLWTNLRSCNGVSRVLDKIKPRVFKMGGHWIWNCNHGDGDMGDTVKEDEWLDPWSVCFALATKHWVMYHDDRIAEEDIEEIRIF